jgi:hypothetical protein
LAPTAVAPAAAAPPAPRGARRREPGHPYLPCRRSAEIANLRLKISCPDISAPFEIENRFQL